MRTRIGVDQKLPKPLEVILRQQQFRLGRDQKIHVLAGRLLLEAAFQIAQKRAGMRRVDDHQLFSQMRLLVDQVPGHRAAPIVRDQGRKLAALALRFDFDQRGNVLHQKLGPVGFDINRRAGFFKPTQVRCHAAVAAVLWLGEMRHQAIPNERPFWKAV